MNSQKIDSWLTKHKHLPGEHDQRTHGNRGSMAAGDSLEVARAAIKDMQTKTSGSPDPKVSLGHRVRFLKIINDKLANAAEEGFNITGRRPAIDLTKKIGDVDESAVKMAIYTNLGKAQKAYNELANTTEYLSAIQTKKPAYQTPYDSANDTREKHRMQTERFARYLDDARAMLNGYYQGEYKLFHGK